MGYHPTDQLGQAVTGAKTAAKEALDQLAALDQELAEERHAHRVEVARLVERAEQAELERDQAELAAHGWQERADAAEAQLATLRARADVRAEDYRKVREALTAAEDQRDRLDSRVHQLQAELRAVRQHPEPEEPMVPLASIPRDLAAGLGLVDRDAGPNG